MRGNHVDDRIPGIQCGRLSRFGQIDHLDAGVTGHLGRVIRAARSR